MARWLAAAFMIGWLGCGASTNAPRTTTMPPAPRPAPSVATPSRSDSAVDQSKSTLVGRVVTTDGTPLRSFDVILAKDFDSPWQHHAVAAADGRFRISDIEPGTWDVMVQEAKTAKRLTGRVFAAGTTTDLGDVIVRVGYAIQGNVMDADGHAVRGAVVTITRYAISRAARDVLYTTTTDSHGHYWFDGVAWILWLPARRSSRRGRIRPCRYRSLSTAVMRRSIWC